MRRKLISIAALIAAVMLTGACALAASKTGQPNGKERDWQRAKLLDPDRTKYFSDRNLHASEGQLDQFQNSSGVVSSVNRPPTSSMAVDEYFIVETLDRVYLVDRVRLQSAHPARLPLTRPVKYAIEKDKLYLLNEDGEEYPTKIVKQIIKDRE